MAPHRRVLVVQAIQVDEGQRHAEQQEHGQGGDHGADDGAGGGEDALLGRPHGGGAPLRVAATGRLAHGGVLRGAVGGVPRLPLSVGAITAVTSRLAPGTIRKVKVMMMKKTLKMIMLILKTLKRRMMI